MKFRFKNLGPIKEANLELGDLTIIAGRNNTGKTYLAYALYGFVKHLKRWSTSTHDTRRLEQPVHITSIISAAAAVGHAEKPVSRDQLEQHRSDFAMDAARLFTESGLTQVFSSQQSRFDGASVELRSALQQHLEPVNIGLDLGERYRVNLRDDRLVMCVDMPDGQPINAHRTKYILRSMYVRFLFPELDLEPFVLTSERFGISLFYRELDFTKNSLVDFLQKMNEQTKRNDSDPFLVIDRMTSRYALPVKDNIDYTRSIPDLRDQSSELSEHKLPSELRHLTSAYYKSSGDSIALTSTARGSRRFSIPLHLASSSARGLSDLYFFLQHVARPNHLLIIDEPESHLDTNNQILMARLLVRCVHAGLKVLITTHSDYLVKEFNNLIMLSRDFDAKEDLLRKLKYDPEDALDPGRIRAYVAENGTLTACSVDKYGMDMPNFDSTIDDINRVTNEISSRIFETDGL